MLSTKWSRLLYFGIVIQLCLAVFLMFRTQQLTCSKQECYRNIRAPWMDDSHTHGYMVNESRSDLEELNVGRREPDIKLVQTPVLDKLHVKYSTANKEGDINLKIAHQVERRTTKAFQNKLEHFVGQMYNETTITDTSNKTYAQNNTRCIDCPHYMTIKYYRFGRYGNHLFQAAAVLATSRKYNYTAALSPETAKELANLIDMSPFKVIPTNSLTNNRYFIAKYAGKFVPLVNSLSTQYNWTFAGLFQSWKFFFSQSEHVRKNLRLKQNLVTAAIFYLNNVKKGAPAGANIVIGVHVRRGDFLQKRHLGFTVGSKDYILKAMDVYRRRYKDKIFKFIFVSDDIRWCKQNFRGAEFAFSSFENSPGKDMALLSLCDHSIITGGTFGWMSAWFCNGDVIYDRAYPGRGTNLGSHIVREDYYPPHWLGLH